MCGRASLTKVEKELEARFHASFYREDIERYNPLPNFNIAPSHYHPVITNEDPDHFHPFRWGLVPFWAKDEKIGYKMINARVETLAEKPSFRQALRNRRCIVPFDGFYEWKKTDGAKLPHFIHRKDSDIFSIAGLWEKWKEPNSGKALFTFTLITLDASPAISKLHDRMPAMLLPEEEALWLQQDIPPEEVLTLIRPFPDELLEIYPVSTKVNNVRNNDPSLLERAG